MTGNHYEGFSNEDVILLEVADHSLHVLPLGIIDFFPNLVGLRWFDGRLTSLTADDLEPFSKLRAVDFGRNRLTSIDGDLFRHNQDLDWLFFDENRLEHVGHDLLTSFPHLRRADFRMNPCIDVNANTTELIAELNLQLPISCPPLEEETTNAPTTLEPVECPVECTDQISSLENSFTARVETLETKVFEQNEVIASYEERLAELEAQVRDLIENPCQTCAAREI